MPSVVSKSGKTFTLATPNKNNGHALQFPLFSDKEVGFSLKKFEKLIMETGADDDVESDSEVVQGGIRSCVFEL